MDPLKEQIALTLQDAWLRTIGHQDGTHWLVIADAILALVQARERALRDELRNALRAHHHPYDHDYERDEKRCPACRRVAVLTEPTP